MIVLANYHIRVIIIKAQLMLGFLFLFSGCTKNRIETTIIGNTMGTTYLVKLILENDSLDYKNIQQGIDSVLNTVNRHMSTWDPKSEISMFNFSNSILPFVASESLIDIMRSSLDISKKTDGLFDVTVYELMRLWGFGPNPKSGIPTMDEVKSVLQSSGYENIKIENGTLIKKNKNLKLDLNAIAKGYGVDKVFDYVKKQGYNDIFIEIGGEVRCSGKNKRNQKWTIGIENPISKNDIKSNICGILDLEEGAVATSGNYRNFTNLAGDIIGHTLNPKTGFPIITDVLSVTVLAKSCILADSWATALMVMNFGNGYQYVKNNPEIEAIWLLKEKENQNRYFSLSSNIPIRDTIYPIR